MNCSGRPFHSDRQEWGQAPLATCISGFTFQCRKRNLPTAREAFLWWKAARIERESESRRRSKRVAPEVASGIERVIVEENTPQAHISALRRILGAGEIATVSGRGYRFTASAIAP